MRERHADHVERSCAVWNLVVIHELERCFGVDMADDQPRAGSAIERAFARVQDLMPQRKPAYRRITPLASRRETQRRAALAILTLVIVVGVIVIAVATTGAAIVVLSLGLVQVHPLLAVGLNLVAAGGLAPTFWGWRHTLVARWFVLGAGVGVVGAWLALLAMAM